MDASPGNPSKSKFTVFLCVLLLLLGDPGRSCPRGEFWAGGETVPVRVWGVGRIWSASESLTLGKN